ncbi:hypothetical protein G3I40_20725 [Streptomyces sp. SID14478]|uniref:C45 family autoproteolytic acyltransferase/hydolase n=1 Tax=Streptomyces sp. SID14478 TaxID=2706073 RepID=UPI0013DB8D35|nr:C45 family peptidase [Streptomyces sp. SID14478]NEB77618.1 hypothetical protein [Streptomyces sp. SID14478]
MKAHVQEQELAGLPWLVVAGSRDQVFHRLGDVTRSEARAAAEPDADDEEFRAWVNDGSGAERLARLAAATRRRFARPWAELAAMAGGAGVPEEELVLLNLRGDLGAQDDGGCSTLAWRRRGVFLAHNEDAFPHAVARLRVVTLAIDGEVPVTALWYPGLLTANAFAVNGHGLVWGVNHIPVLRPDLSGSGRHFVARAMQQAASPQEAVTHLHRHASAGGYAHTIGSGPQGPVRVVEAAAGQVAEVEARADHPLHWHTNHLRHLPDPPDLPVPNGGTPASGTGTSRTESHTRGRVLAALPVPGQEPSTEWFLRILTSPAPSGGVLRTAVGGDPLRTVCSVVADLSARILTVRGPEGKAVALLLDEFAHGRHTSA